MSITSPPCMPLPFAAPLPSHHFSSDPCPDPPCATCATPCLHFSSAGDECGSEPGRRPAAGGLTKQHDHPLRSAHGAPLLSLPHALSLARAPTLATSASTTPASFITLPTQSCVFTRPNVHGRSCIARPMLWDVAHFPLTLAPPCRGAVS